MNNLFECGKCSQAFDWDLDLLESDKEHRLPVSCKFCPYAVCYSCFCRKMAKDIRRGKGRGYLECPGCGNGIGFYYSKEEPASSICPFACSLLRQAQTQPAAAAASHHAEAEASSENVARMPLHHDKSDDDSITGASSNVQRQMTDIGDDSKMPAVTQSQLDDEGDDDTIAAEPSTSKDEDNNDDVAQSEAVSSDQPNSVSTPKRKRKSRSGESQDESSNDVAVVTPSPKKKRNVDSEKPAFEITQAERQALKDRPRWLDEFAGYLRNNLQLSENNIKRVVDSINHLRLGHGVNYAPKSQEPIKFQRGVMIDLSTNLQEVLEAAKAFENEHGKDTSRGWKVRHPITKLALFQEHVVELMRAESSSENDE
jgi:hypothetical protein